jgi:hypothetical protein
VKTVEVTIAGRSYTVTPLPIRRNREWRSQFEPILQDISAFVSDLGSYAGEEFTDAPDMINRLGKVLSGRLPALTQYLLSSLDLITVAVFDYSPEIAEDREYLEENGYDHEIVAAFLQVLQLAFPFGPAVRVLTATGQKSGQKEPSTDPNLPSASLE